MNHWCRSVVSLSGVASLLLVRATDKEGIRLIGWIRKNTLSDRKVLANYEQVVHFDKKKEIATSLRWAVIPAVFLIISIARHALCCHHRYYGSTDGLCFIFMESRIFAVLSGHRQRKCAGHSPRGSWMWHSGCRQTVCRLRCKALMRQLQQS